MKEIRWMTPWLVALMLVALLLPATTTHATPSVNERFQDYYTQHQGMRILGYPLTDLTYADGHPAQYFEKGRLEDHRGVVADPTWAFMYGRLTVELMERDPDGSVNEMGITYAALAHAAQPRWRQAAPAGFPGGTMPISTGMFVPYDAQLRPAPGHVVPMRFWNYINHTDLFPGGWLHDIGLPLTAATTVETYKNGELREITYQAFERTVLTYDPQNPTGWQVERGNIGQDALRTWSPPASSATIELPQPDAPVTLPLHLQATVWGGQPGEQVTATLRRQDGTQFSQSFTLLRGKLGGGLAIGNLSRLSPGDPPPTQPATLELRSAGGNILARQPVRVLGPDDPNTTEVTIYWLHPEREEVMPHTQRVVKTPAIGTAALNELLWGPPRTQIGFRTALPTPEDVLNYPGNRPDWGPRVTLRSLTIEDGVATADFSQEIRAYGGGSLRVRMIREQITQTLLQFPTVDAVIIAVEGETEGVLQP